ncbi:helix-turn-helix domain-containing protein [Paenibacillus lignilyticus]|uniref:AraC family transcriptional regulator n=1 Tax=Paenibacillus lignilyticus TaxID=1172615 RepID=A0ABS5CC93_9BACL|nr:helix-turn-helix domain-containing protein [Paenibacillus lignilyticus]MBP3961755.1 AraC family transcriptional regulator [Paenibacillus lignilyticus]MBP3963574.1 AraC family transcriptional regulator [Paenibacillus lignilyticus]
MECLQLPIPPLPQFVTVGHSIWRPGNQHFKRNFPMYDMLLVIKGTIYMTEDERPYAVGAGDLLLLEPGHTHVGHRPCDEDTEIYWIHFYHPLPAVSLSSHQISWSSILEPGTDADFLPRRQSLFLPKWANIDPKPLLPILREMLTIQQKLNLENAARLHGLLVRLLEQLQQLTIESTKPSRSLTLSRRLEEFLPRFIKEPFHSASLEEQFHFNAEYLSRCLKKHTGKTPVQYIRYLKIEEAKRLLAAGELPVPVIAEAIGVEDYNYFIRMFRETTGQTPGDYRSSRQGLS